jgi:ribose transport system permease protein
LPAFAAAMLGSTQLKRGRFNIWGTVISVYVLATGITGLRLAGAPVWIPDLFNGVALLVAVAVTARQRRPRVRRPDAGSLEAAPVAAVVAETKGR